jgi:hypothetical protein
MATADSRPDCLQVCAVKAAPDGRFGELRKSVRNKERLPPVISHRKWPAWGRPRRALAVDFAVHVASKQGFRLLVEDEPLKAYPAACVVDSFLAASTPVVG